MISLPVAVLGAGAWGTALANSVASTGRHVVLWGRDRSQIEMLARDRENRRYLPGVALHANVQPAHGLARAAQAEIILAAIPAQNLRDVACGLAVHVLADKPIIACAKGIEQSTGLFVCDVLAQVLPRNPIAILSGPSFAADVARGLPTAVTLAAIDPGLAAQLGRTLSSANLRVYSSDDVRGVEIGGAAKNVLAIACGIAAGAKLGASAGAALLARGFAELSRFGQALGARPETLMGLSGLGDLVLTCTSPQSRNFSFGYRLGGGASPEAVLAGGKLVEGAYTAAILVKLARQHSLEMPICEGVDSILAGQASVAATIGKLLARPLGPEN